MIKKLFFKIFYIFFILIGSILVIGPSLNGKDYYLFILGFILIFIGAGLKMIYDRHD